MSFSTGVKEELVRIRLKTPALRLAQLSGLSLSCGSLSIRRSGTGLTLSTETLSVGKLIASLALSLYDLDAEVGVAERERRRAPLTVVSLAGADAERLLHETGVLVPSGDGVLIGESVPVTFAQDDEACRAFLRGAFLGSGSCADPKRGYHLEIVLRADALAESMRGLLAQCGLFARMHRRNDRAVLYLKGDDVEGFLALIGASVSVLKYADARTEKEYRNYINRRSNCEVANIGKTVDAAVAQMQAIETIETRMELSRLPAPLYEAAMLRLNHPEATLQELADLAEIGKSGMNHRLIRLLKLAEELEND